MKKAKSSNGRAFDILKIEIKKGSGKSLREVTVLLDDIRKEEDDRRRNVARDMPQCVREAIEEI